MIPIRETFIGRVWSLCSAVVRLVKKSIDDFGIFQNRTNNFLVLLNSAKHIRENFVYYSLAQLLQAKIRIYLKWRIGGALVVHIQ